MEISVIVVTYDRRQLVLGCLATVDAALTAVDGECEIILVDNGSSDGTVAAVCDVHPAARIVALARNEGFAGGVAAGLEWARGEWIALVNNDAELERDALKQLVKAGRSSADVGSVAAQMRFAHRPDLINSAGIDVDRLGVAVDRKLGEPVDPPNAPMEEVFGASGGAALLRRTMLDQVGGLDPSFFAYLEDVDLAWRARAAGWRALYVPGAIVVHHHSVTSRHGSPFKHWLVGRNRVRVLARNADGTDLRRYGVAILVHDLAQVLFVMLITGSLAGVRGRLRGLREWRTYRSAGAMTRRRVALSPPHGLAAAFRRNAVWSEGGSPPEPRSTHG